jgi:hypothetical protein
MPSGAEQLLSRRSGCGRGGRCRHREVAMGCQAPQTLHPEPGLDRPAGVAVVVAVQDVRTPATPLVALSAVEVRPMVGRTSGVHATGVQATGRSGYPDGHASGIGGRCIGRPHRAGSWNGWVRPAHPRCAAGWRCRCGRRAAWSSLPSRDWRARDGRTVGSAVARRRVGGRPGPPPRMRRGRGAALPPGRPREPVQRPVPVGWLGSTRGSRCFQVPGMASWAGAGALSGHGAGAGGGDHARWSLSWSCSGVVRLRRPHRLKRT